MKVKELIEKLQDMDEEQEVLIYSGDEGNFVPVSEVGVRMDENEVIDGVILDYE